MKIIFGLGNPGQQYKNNRHNVGYMAADEAANAQGISFKKSFKLSAFAAKKNIGQEEVFFIKPRTYMNNSGLCVKKTLDNYKLSIQDILIIYDDADLPLGEIRFRQKGSCAGHRGMNSVISIMETEQVNRLRIGIGKPDTGELSDYVLSDFFPQEREALGEIIRRAVSVCMDWVYRNGNFLTNKKIIVDNHR